MGDKKTNWNEPLQVGDILEQIKEFSEKTVDYREDFILGFPTTTPDSINLTVAERYLLQQSNAIGLHTKTNSKLLSERGFLGIQQAEREVVYMVADVVGALPNEIDGYICSGATEGNIAGLWIARNMFKKERTALMSSLLSHYSLQKAINLLNFPKENLYLMSSDENGHLSTNDFETTLQKIIKDGIKNIILFTNVGTTMLGSVDNIASLNKLSEEYASRYGIRIYIHVDAAFGGMISPFLSHLPTIGFENNHVMSIAVDLHKTGKAPFGAGVLLARKGLFDNIETHAPYFPGNDHTLSGSRPGIIVLQCWATLRALGRAGYRKRAEEFFDTANNIKEFLEKYNFNCFQNDLNIVAVRGEPIHIIKEKYITHVQNNFPTNLQNVTGSQTTTVWNIVVLDHTKRFVQNLYKDIEETFDKYVK